MFFQAVSPVVFVHTDAFSSGNEFLHLGDPVILSSDLKWQDNVEQFIYFWRPNCSHSWPYSSSVMVEEAEMDVTKWSCFHQH